MRRAFVLVAMAATGAAAAPSVNLRFVTCPIYRDTDAGRKSGCWLADDPATGTRYDVTSAPTKPDWNRAVLVEGRLASDTLDPCGGTVMEPVRVSVLDQPCARFMLSGDGYAGRKFALPRRNVRPLYEVRTPPPPPFTMRTIAVPFDFGSSFITYQLGDYYLDQAINYALDVQPAQVTVVGYAATAPERVSGETLVEQPVLARTRADIVTRALMMRGIPAGRIVTRVSRITTTSADPAFEDIASASRRRVEVTVTPGR